MLLCLAHPGPSEPLFTGEPMRVKRLAPGSKMILAFCRHCENFLGASTTRKNLLRLPKAHRCSLKHQRKRRAEFSEDHPNKRNLHLGRHTIKGRDVALVSNRE